MGPDTHRDSRNGSSTFSPGLTSARRLLCVGSAYLSGSRFFSSVFFGSDCASAGSQTIATAYAPAAAPSPGAWVLRVNVPSAPTTPDGRGAFGSAPTGWN